MVDTTAASESKPIVFVADDDEMQRFLMRAALEAEGFAVEAVADGAAAVELGAKLRPDVVVLDVVMPGMDGHTACAALRALPDGAQLPIVMVTGQGDVDSVARAYDAGATDFIAKPLNWTLFRHRIRYVYRAGATLKQLRASETRLAEAQRIAQLGSWEWDTTSSELQCSREVYRIFRLPECDGALPFDRLLDQIHFDDREDFWAKLEQLRSSHTTLSAEFRLAGTDGSTGVIAVNAKVDDENADGTITMKGTFQDVTERRTTEAQLHYLAHHDAVTGLPNRPLFQDRLGQALARARREGIDAAVFCIDIDRFKDINDTFGHEAGDRLLQDMATRLQNEVRGADTVARLGGDEFAIAQVGLVQPVGAERLSHRLLAALGRPFDLDGQELYIGASIGVAIGPHDAGDAEQLLIRADMALHRVKADGGGSCHFFEGGLDIAFRARKKVEQDLRQALADDWFELHYQPQVLVENEAMVGVEALLRLRHPENGLMMPDKFIAIAEETGLIVPIGNWVLRTACRQAMAWQRAGLAAIRVAVNLSPAQFREGGFAEEVTEALTDTGLDPRLLEVEITENVLIRDTATVIDVLHKLRELGVQIAMDDFGTGYSSLSYLQRFPFDRIKIDRSFVQDMSDNPDAAAIVGAVVALGRRLNMSTTAEGVETREQFECLKTEACDEVQGYYFGRPMPADTLIETLRQGLTVDAPVS